MQSAKDKAGVMRDPMPLEAMETKERAEYVRALRQRAKKLDRPTEEIPIP